MGGKSALLFGASGLVGRELLKCLLCGSEYSKVSALITKRLNFIFIGAFKKYKPIAAKTVASGMYRAAQSSSEGIHTYLSNEIPEIP